MVEKPVKPIRPDLAPPSFDITKVVGRITFSEEGDMNAYEAAFLLIARDDSEGTYVFDYPTQDKSLPHRVSVTVEFPNDEKREEPWQ